MQPLDKAKEAALRLVKFRPRSEKELQVRLLQKGFGPETIEGVLLEFKRRGLIDDEKFSKYFASGKLLMKPVGKRSIFMQLKSKGVSESLAASALEKAYEGLDEFTMARSAALARLVRLQGLPKEALERRLFGFLSRRGFSSEMVRRVVKELSP